MKANIHPQWYPEAQVTCACGNKFAVGSTQPEIQVEICSQCHPFFTGSMKYVDTAGRVEKFQAKQNAVLGKKLLKKKERRLLKRLEREKEEKDRPKTFREMLQKSASKQE